MKPNLDLLMLWGVAVPNEPGSGDILAPNQTRYQLNVLSDYEILALRVRLGASRIKVALKLRVQDYVWLRSRIASSETTNDGLAGTIVAICSKSTIWLLFLW